MRIKVSPFDLDLLKQSTGIFSLIIGIGSAVLAFVDFDSTIRGWIFGSIIFLVFVVYVIKLYIANTMSSLTLNFNSSTIEIRGQLR